MRFSITTALAFALFGSALADPGVTPASVAENADPGSSFDVDKVVTTPEIPPNPDVVLLVDVTGSMGGAIDNIKTGLVDVINNVTAEQPSSQFAVASFGELGEPNGFQVNQPLTNDIPALQAAVNSLTPEGGEDIPEDWINALYELSTGAITFRGDSSRIIVLVGDAVSHDPSGGHSLDDTIGALLAQSIRVIGVNVNNLDGRGQATAVTSATGGDLVGASADEVTDAIISGLKNLNITVKPDVVSCDASLTVEFSPTESLVSSGTNATFLETVKIASDAAQGATLSCSVSFLLDDVPGGDAFIQSIAVTVNQMGCYTCLPYPGQDLCDVSTICTGTPYGTMCLAEPGYKADGAADDDIKVQWRMIWPDSGQEHRVAVKPGISANTPCDNPGPTACDEVTVANCSAVGGVRYDTDQKVIGGGEL